MSEPLTLMLAELPLAEPDAARAARVRARCRQRLGRWAPSAAVSRVPPSPRFRTGQIWQPLIAVLSVVYLTEVIVQALRVYFSEL